MNHLLKQFAVESYLNSDNVPYHVTDYYDIDDYPNVEKFAELIVRECLNIVVNSDMVDLEGPDPDDVLCVVSKKIKKHFGIKE